MEEARLAVEHLTNAPIGRLRFSMPTCLGSGLLPKLYSEFLPRYPGIVLDAHTSETCVDIVAGGYDVAIRVAQRLTDSTLHCLMSPRRHWKPQWTGLVPGSPVSRSLP